jgi:hypothetical protein
MNFARINMPPNFHQNLYIQTFLQEYLKQNKSRKKGEDKAPPYLANQSNTISRTEISA